jgi:hypothetical protein
MKNSTISMKVFDGYLALLSMALLFGKGRLVLNWPLNKPFSLSKNSGL